MTPKAASSSTVAAARRSRALGRGLAFALIAAVILVTVVGACVALTDPAPKTLPRRTRQWLVTRLGRPPARTALVPRPTGEEPTPLYSDDWFDDSGYSLAVRFSTTITDPTSLAQLRSSSEGRGRRGAALMESKLAGFPADDPATPYHTSQHHLFIGALWMYEGEFATAGRHFEKAQSADPARPAAFRANMEVLRGMAALRRGEVENCVACRSESSCIFPIAPGAVHRRTSGSREAIAHFTRYLEQRPEDLGVRWLLNLAYMTLGRYPQDVPREFLLPLGRFSPTGGSPVQRLINVSPRVGLDARGPTMAGGCMVDDFDGDGRLDVFTTTVDPSRGASLGHNRGDGTFEDRSEAAGLDDQVQALNGRHADFNNDGALDVLLLRGGWETARRLSLLRNRGDGTFEDVTLRAGLDVPIASQAADWADFDGDGWIDLYVAGEFNPQNGDRRNRGRLYRNRGDGTFADVAEAAGVINEGFGKGVAWGDYDDDGRPDLYVSNFQNSNRLYHNNGDGTFTDVAGALGVTEPFKGFACWFWDYDNDGRLDLWVNGYDATMTNVIRDQLGRPAKGERPRLYRNLGGAEGFRDVTAQLGLDRVVLPMGSNFGDIDNDGFLDIYLGTGRPGYSYLEPNVLFRNDGGLRFEDATEATGTGHLQKGHGVSFADWDRDGDLDLFVVSGGATPGDRAHNILFQNPGNGRHWLTVKLVGTKTNRAAIGAKVRLDLPGGDGGGVVSRHRTIGAGSSFGGNPLPCTIGLGTAGSIAMLEITWPTSGLRQAFHDVPIDRSVEITEGRAGFRVLDAPSIPLPR